MIWGILLITGLGLAYQAFILHEYKVHPEWAKPGTPTASTNSASAQNPSPSSQPGMAAASTQPSTESTGWAISQAAPTTMPTTEPAMSAGAIVVGSEDYKDPRAHVALEIDPHGAGLNGVVLNSFHEAADSDALYRYQTAYDLEGQTRSLATAAIILDGNRIDLWDKTFTLVDQSNHSAVYQIDFQQNGQPAVRLTKEYLLDATDAASQGYEVLVKYTFANLSAQPHTVSLEFNGPTLPQAETARQETEVAGGYDNGGLVRIDHNPVSYFHGSTPSKDFIPNDDKLPLLWFGSSSNYFNALVRPDSEGKIQSALAQAINPDASADQRLVAIHFRTVDFNLAGGASTDLPLHVFLGPKQRALLDTAYYSGFPLHYDGTLVMVSSGICAFCTIPWLINVLVALLAGLEWVLRDWGLAIIALVCGVRLLLHPITKRSQVSMMKMQKLAPEIERLKKKFGDDKEGFGKAQMELYKTVGFTPILGCLPMFLQMPIFIALWRALQTTFELRQAPFLYFFGIHWTWIHDLSQPDQLINFASPIPLLVFGWHLSAINVLPLAMAVVTFINQKYFMPRPAALSPEQEQQQKMMMWMTLVFPFMFYTFPSGLNLYYLTTTGLGIIESKRIRDHIKQAEAAEAASGPIIVDAGRLSRTTRRAAALPEKPQAKGFIARLQEKAEEMAREAQRQQQKKKR